MSTPTAAGRPLRVALFGLTVIVVGYALFAAWLGFHAYDYVHARDRATETAAGVVVEDEIGGDEDIRVRWTDGTGRTHVQRFGIYDVDRYAKGKHFPVAYDPDDADPRGFPADPDETAAEEDLVVPMVLGGLVALPLCFVWAWRGLRFLRTRRRPGRPMTAAFCYGERFTDLWRSPDTAWLVLAEPDRPDRPVLWQRVMWHPALDDCEGPVPVTVHRSARGGRRPAVVELPDGTRLVPLGHAHHGAPRRVILDDYAATRGNLRDLFIVPAGTDGHPAGAWWRPAVQPAAIGTVMGVVAGFAMGGGTLVAEVGSVLAFATLLTAAWALSAPQP